jgi:hypothetical protein
MCEADGRSWRLTGVAIATGVGFDDATVHVASPQNLSATHGQRAVIAQDSASRTSASTLQHATTTLSWALSHSNRPAN